MPAGMIEIDGSQGEGGGQILRTALALSAITGRSFQIKNIRRQRSRPGMMSQHLASVRAAAAVCNAETADDFKGSSSLIFKPGLCRGGSYSFAVGSAGSALLVFQTLFPILSTAPAESNIELSGGTHNPKAPPFEFIDQVFLPSLEEAGFHAKISLERHGFAPRGGGIVKGKILPRRDGDGIEIMERGVLREMRPLVLIADLDD